MKNLSLIGALLLSMAIIFSGCGASKTVKGAGIGAGAGGALGAGIGAIAGGAGWGALIGAAVGGTAGALIGNKMDKQKKEIEESIPDVNVETVNDGEALKVTFDSGILFATNSSTISNASKTALDKFATTLKNNPETDIKIVGFTDSTGNADYNQTLSEKRAQSVYDELLRDGVSSNRMYYEGMGERNPVADNSSDVGRSQNRRVEILILANDNMVKQAREGTLQ